MAAFEDSGGGGGGGGGGFKFASGLASWLVGDAAAVADAAAALAAAS